MKKDAASLLSSTTNWLVRPAAAAFWQISESSAINLLNLTCDREERDFFFLKPGTLAVKSKGPTPCFFGPAMIAGTHKMVSVQHSCKSAMTHDCDDVDTVKAFNCHLRRIKIRSSSEAVCLFAKTGEHTRRLAQPHLL